MDPVHGAHFGELSISEDIGCSVDLDHDTAAIRSISTRNSGLISLASIVVLTYNRPGSSKEHAG